MIRSHTFLLLMGAVDNHTLRGLEGMTTGKERGVMVFSDESDKIVL